MAFKFNLMGKDRDSGQSSIVLISLFLVGGLLMAGYGFMQYQGQSQSLENAVNITGAVTDTEIRTDSSRRGGIDYLAEVTFKYSFRNEDYTSDFIYPLDDEKEFNQESKAEEFIDNYPEGGEVQASVNPEKPGGAFLMAKRSSQPVLFMIIGGLMVLAAGYKSVQTV